MVLIRVSHDDDDDASDGEDAKSENDGDSDGGGDSAEVVLRVNYGVKGIALVTVMLMRMAMVILAVMSVSPTMGNLNAQRAESLYYSTTGVSVTDVWD